MLTARLAPVIKLDAAIATGEADVVVVAGVSGRGTAYLSAAAIQAFSTASRAAIIIAAAGPSGGHMGSGDGMKGLVAVGIGLSGSGGLMSLAPAAAAVGGADPPASLDILSFVRWKTGVERGIP